MIPSFRGTIRKRDHNIVKKNLEQPNEDCPLQHEVREYSDRHSDCYKYPDRRIIFQYVHVHPEEGRDDSQWDKDKG